MDDTLVSTLPAERVAAMGKSKQAQNLTHEQIWDDSALVRSWDEAVEEYQLYHSIHAKGENVEDVLREAEAAGLAEEDEPLAEGEVMGEDEAMEVPNDGAKTQLDETATGAAPEAAPSVNEAPRLSSTGGQTPATAPGATVPAGAMPEPVLSHVQDENLKRLMMAWYYAGYYTGLYEGQQQASQGKS